MYNEYLVTFSDKRDGRIYKYYVCVPKEKREQSIETILISAICDLFPSTRIDNIKIEMVHTNPIKYKNMEFYSVYGGFSD